MTELLAAAERTIVAWSGVVAWRPLFQLGLATAIAGVVAVVVLIAALRAAR